MICSPRLLSVSLCVVLALSAGCSAFSGNAGSKYHPAPVTPEAQAGGAAQSSSPGKAAAYLRYGLGVKFDASGWSQEEIAAANFISAAEIYFYFDSAALTPDAKEILRQKADRMKAVPQIGLLVAGHSDERGGDEYNLALGERRARAARDYLASLGVSAARLETVSFGKRFPVDSGSGESAWSRNRRDEFLVFKP